MQHRIPMAGLALLAICGLPAWCGTILYSVAPGQSGGPALYRIDTSAQTATEFLKMGDGSLGFNGGLVYSSAGNVFYAIANDFQDNSSLVTFSPINSNLQTLNTVFQGGHGGLALQSANGSFYAVASDVTGFATLYQVPKSCCGAIAVAPLGLGFTGGLAFEPGSGLFYSIANDLNGQSTLYQINTGSQQVTPLALTLGLGYYGGLTYDASAGRFYAISSDVSGYSSLVAIDVAGGTVQSLFGLGFGFVNAGLTVGPDSFRGSGVPEPSTAPLVLLPALVGVAYRRTRRR